MTTRRRFITIAAAAMTLPRMAQSQPLHVWQGVALGARATIRLAHRDAAQITARMAAEIERLEQVFSLYRADSALSRLNAAGALKAPPFELLECLTLAGAVHRATDGRFDPTVQRLWATHAEAAAQGRLPLPADLAAARALGGWHDLRLGPDMVTLRPGMALTLNGIAQGYIADRVAALLVAEGLDDILIDTGELRALGGTPEGGDWPVKLAAGGSLPLRGRALATSALLGTTFDAAGLRGHILDPVTGQPATGYLRMVSISAPSAALADALSTAACLMPSAEALARSMNQFSGVRCEAAVTA